VRKDKGGCTTFPELNGGKGLAVQPVRGKALLFSNLLSDGNPDPLTVHKAEPVEGGQHKFGMNIWVSGHSMQHTTMLKGKAVSIIPKGKENLAAQVMQHFKNPDSEAVEEEEEKENAVTVEVSPMKAPSKAKAKGLANKKTQITSPLAAGKKRKAESPAATKTAGRPKRR